MFKIGRKSKRKKKRFKIFDKISKHRESHSRKNKLKKQIKRDKKSKHLEVTYEKIDKAAYNSYYEHNSVSNDKFVNKLDKTKSKITSNTTNTSKNNTNLKYKENKEYVDKVRSQVKDVLQENYDDSFEKLFANFENSGFINKDNFLFRLIFMILKKYNFIDIFDENGEIDLNAIDEILKSVIKDAYKTINDEEASNQSNDVIDNEDSNQSNDVIDNEDSNQSNDGIDNDDINQNYDVIDNDDSDKNNVVIDIEHEICKDINNKGSKKILVCNEYNDDCFKDNFYDDE